MISLIGKQGPRLSLFTRLHLHRGYSFPSYQQLHLISNKRIGVGQNTLINRKRDYHGLFASLLEKAKSRIPFKDRSLLSKSAIFVGGIVLVSICFTPSILDVLFKVTLSATFVMIAFGGALFYGGIGIVAFLYFCLELVDINVRGMEMAGWSIHDFANRSPFSIAYSNTETEKIECEYLNLDHSLDKEYTENEYESILLHFGLYRCVCDIVKKYVDQNGMKKYVDQNGRVSLEKQWGFFRYRIPISLSKHQ
jgi:hypothetical protein